MAEPFDQRDVTLTGGGGRPSKRVRTHYETTSTGGNVTSTGVEWARSVGTPANGETTWHDVRIFGPGSELVAKIIYRRVVTPTEGIASSSHELAPDGDFTATSDLTSGHDQEWDASTTEGKVTVTLWVVVEPTFSKSVSLNDAKTVATVKISKEADSWHLGTLTNKQI